MMKLTFKTCFIIFVIFGLVDLIIFYRFDFALPHTVLRFHHIPEIISLFFFGCFWILTLQPIDRKYRFFIVILTYILAFSLGFLYLIINKKPWIESFIVTYFFSIFYWMGIWIGLKYGVGRDRGSK